MGLFSGCLPVRHTIRRANATECEFYKTDTDTDKKDVAVNTSLSGEGTFHDVSSQKVRQNNKKINIQWLYEH